MSALDGDISGKWLNNHEFQLSKGLEFHSLRAGITLEAEAGEIVNFASVPKWLPLGLLAVTLPAVHFLPGGEWVHAGVTLALVLFANWIRLLIPPRCGQHGPADALHDAEYRKGRYPRIKIDIAYDEAMKALDTDPRERFRMKWAVILCGWLPWYQHRARDLKG